MELLTQIKEDTKKKKEYWWQKIIGQVVDGLSSYFDALNVDLNELSLLSELNIKEDKIGQGVDKKVYLLKSRINNLLFVIKIQGNIDWTVNVAYRVARLSKKRIEFIQDILGDDIIPSEYKFISKINKSGELGIISIQRFMGEDSFDIFYDISKETLVKLLKEDNALNRQVSRFLNRVEREFIVDDKIIDLVGSNLFVVRGENGDRFFLKYIDADAIFVLNEEGWLLYNKSLRNFKYLKKIYHKSLSL